MGRWDSVKGRCQYLGPDPLQSSRRLGLLKTLIKLILGEETLVLIS